MGYKGQYAEARRWNREAYEQYLADLEASRGRYGEALEMSTALRESVLGQYDLRTEQDRLDWERAMDASLAAQRQTLAARGLAGSSIAGTTYAGSQRERAAGLNRLADERLRGRIGLETGLTGQHIGLLQAGPTAPSTAFFNATVANLNVATNYKLQKEAMAYAQQGPTKSFSEWYSGFMAPGALEQRGYAIAQWLGGPSLQPSDPYYGGYGAAQAQPQPQQQGLGQPLGVGGYGTGGGGGGGFGGGGGGYGGGPGAGSATGGTGSLWGYGQTPIFV
jgi:hypothetical protein